MKREKVQVGGFISVFTGSPSIVMGGFNLDKEKQRFDSTDVIPAGTLTIVDEEKRLVSVIKTGYVAEVGTDKKVVTLKVTESYNPIFVAGDKVAKVGAISGTFKDAAQIVNVSKTDNTFVITLSKEIDTLVKGDVLIEVVDKSSNAAVIGNANSISVSPQHVGSYETNMDVSKDTMQYVVYRRRVSPIPADQLDATGQFLKDNPHVKFTKSN